MSEWQVRFNEVLKQYLIQVEKLDVVDINYVYNNGYSEGCDTCGHNSGYQDGVSYIDGNGDLQDYQFDGGIANFLGWID